MNTNTKMTQIVELSGKDFKATISKMFQPVIMKTTETNGKSKVSANKQKT